MKTPRPLIPKSGGPYPQCPRIDAYVANRALLMLVAHHSRRFLPPPRLDGVQRVSSLLVLGVTLEDNLRVTAHVERTLEACSRSLYALRELRSHMACPPELSTRSPELQPLRS